REDACAWEAALRLLGNLVQLSGERAWRFDEFVETTLATWAEAFYSLRPGDEDRVQVLEVYDAREHDFRAAFVLGLVAGVFPRRPREDPFFRDDEREALALHSGVVLPLSMAQADEDRLLFYQALSTPRERLVLSYPKTDGDGMTLRSFFLDEVEQA